jgi:hypothetical protein
LEKLLKELYMFVKKDFAIWTAFWLPIYERCIEKEDFKVVKGIINNVNGMICNIDTSLIKFWLKKVCQKKNYTIFFIFLTETPLLTNLD